ncbi:hypothetical protein [Caproicibacterium lactatifermentans]|jgi:hypothetical protein|uniref:hypothetical protein n=1 Tax=Caproicibacterium lactatifermentans TaxID=2666138 RepID=UPI003D8FDB65
MKRVIASVLAAAMIGVSFTACGSASPRNQAAASFQTNVDKVIAEAEKMTNQELYKKAIEESKGKTMYGIGNSSRGATAGTNFVKMLKTIDSSYDGKVEWSQPKNNSIFTLLTSDIASAQHTYSMTLIQDGNQIQSKMLNTGYLKNFIPKDWLAANGADEKTNGHPFALQSQVKVFAFNNVGGAKFNNCWDFVYKDQHPMFMGVNSEPVGKNFLYMLTDSQYADMMKSAFDSLSADKKAYFQPIVNSMAGEGSKLGLTGDNVKYSLAWIKLWCQQYNKQTDDGPTCTQLVTKSAANQSALLVNSKFRSIEESASSSKKNVTIAVYQDGYHGIGGFSYKHYLQVLKTSPLPWTACAFIAYMTTNKDGYVAWGKDMGSYCSNPSIMQDHSKDGYVNGVNTFAVKNDKPFSWWTSNNGGRLVVEDPAYCAKTSSQMSDWVDSFVSSKG